MNGNGPCPAPSAQYRQGERERKARDMQQYGSKVPRHRYGGGLPGIVLLSCVMGAFAPGGASADPVAANTPVPLALSPPMGFNNWARFMCVPQAPLDGRNPQKYSFQDFMTDQGRGLVSTGLARVGYKTVVVDDCWMQRDGDGQLYGASHWSSPRHGNSTQPGFARDLTPYVADLHRMGLLAGVYNTSGALTCERVPSGEAGHQNDDARKFSGWGVDFLKLDNCGAPETSLEGLFGQMGHALGAATAHSDRKILFDESAPAEFGPTDPLKYQSMQWVRGLGQMWRVAPDIATTRPDAQGHPMDDPWVVHDPARAGLDGVYQAFTDTVALSRYVGPGNWNDADQLLPGDNGLTTAEERSQMGLWSIMGAPLVLSADVRQMARAPDDPHLKQSLAILGNPRAIAIDQDTLGAGGYRILRDNPSDDAGTDIALKPLADGGFAFLVLNKNPQAATYDLPMSRLGVEGGQCPLALTDVWTGKVTHVAASGTLSLRMEPHDNAMYRVAPAACMSLRPSGQITTVQAAFGRPPLCLDAGRGNHVMTAACSASPAQQWVLPDTRAEGPIHNAAFADKCLELDTETGQVRMAACHSGTATQTFRYHLNGTLSAAGSCLDVAGAAVNFPGERIMTAKCIAWRVSEIFSAPHHASPAE
ncbi:hypothetical protein CFR71_10615 [Novacetimonas pomaceti]|uniref:Alpha-galactosidase n=2 Tax=Novacetimonas pomaceti TaxID=2021998 RepID=A0A318QR37_9PROT|nr:hypothetical protein CFR71_10615 [Novacetimonas pomaceti]